ncbi:putative Phox domain, sorting nexin, PX domain superfamily [Helianthus annuus]|nr:putative Phox domain, sorting nexin, PX domain superfamily [Helianthus annuus]
METLHDLIEEARLRTVWWTVCIFIVTYFLTHTSKSMWMNIPIAIMIISVVHIVISEVDFHWKIRRPNRQSYLSHLERKQMSVNDSRLSALPQQPKWKRKIDSPVVEAALEDFVNKLLQEFVLDLWYSDITPDKEAPQLIHAIIMDIFAEVSIRVKDINLVDLLTRDLVDLVGDHLELFRKNQAAIGTEVMVTLSSEERDERLKRHLMASKELHPALISSESEYKFLKRIMGAVLAAVLRPREAQCPLVRCIVRELLTCLVMEPVMRFASPGHINELIEGFLLANNNKEGNEAVDDKSTNVTGQNQNQQKSQELTSTKSDSSSSQKNNTPNDQNGTGLNPPGPMVSGPVPDVLLNTRSSAWARVRAERRKEVLQPENLENMWTKGKNYKKKTQKQVVRSGINEYEYDQQQNLDGRILSGESKISDPSDIIDGNTSSVTNLKSSNSVSDQNQVGGPIISEFYSANVGVDNDVPNVNNVGSEQVTRTDGYVPKLRCRVLGAYFENLDSKSFAVYSIAVTDADNKTWFVKRRYRNFERLHRHLKAIPNYTLHLPPKRIFSSSTEDAFVHQRCIQLDKYLQDLLSIANIAEQHEVWDFLSMSSRSYSFGRSSSVVRTLAVNVGDAVDDTVRQFKGVSGGLKKKAAGPGLPSESSASVANRNVANSSSYKEGRPAAQSNERNGISSEVRSDLLSVAANYPSTSGLKEDPLGVPAEWAPPNVSLPLLNLVDKIFQLNRRGWLRRQVFWISKQILQLMMEDAIDDWLLRQIRFLRRDSLVAQGIYWIQDVLWPEGTFFLKLRANQTDSSQSNESSCKTPSGSKNNKGSFEERLEAARRASDIKKMILEGAPTTLVSLIGHKQYTRSAQDIYYFLQSAVCLKQFGYSLLELVLITVFPELQDIVTNIHEKKNDPAV